MPADGQKEMNQRAGFMLYVPVFAFSWLVLLFARLFRGLSVVERSILP